MTDNVPLDAADDRDGFDLLLREKALERALAGLAGLPIEKIVAALAAGFGADSDAFKTRVVDLIAAGCLSDEDRAFVDSISNLDDNGRDEFNRQLRASLKAEIKPNAATRAAIAEADEIAKSRRARLTIDTGDDTAAAMAASKMDPRHDRLNALLDAQPNAEVDLFAVFLRDFGLEHLDGASREALRNYMEAFSRRHETQLLEWLAEDVQRRPSMLKEISPELAARITALTEGVSIDGEPNAEAWLHEEVVPAYDAMKADPSRGRSIADVRASLAAELARQGGPNRRAMSKEEIDAMWGHGDEPNAETIAAMNEARRGGLKSFSSIGDLMTDLNDDNAAGDNSETGQPKPD